MSLAAISNGSFSYTGTVTTPQTAAGGATTAQVTVAMSSTTVDTYEGPSYSVPSLGISGFAATDTVNGVPVSEYADAKVTGAGSVSESQETSLSLSYTASGSSGSKTVELGLESDSTLSPGGNSSAEVAVKLLEDTTSDQSMSSQGGQQPHLGQVYDATI